jgi:hypothetical protein
MDSAEGASDGVPPLDEAVDPPQADSATAAAIRMIVERRGGVIEGGCIGPFGLSASVEWYGSVMTSTDT